MSRNSEERLVACVRSLVGARVAGASPEEQTNQATVYLHCDPEQAGEIVDLALGAAQVAIRADEGEAPLAVWREMGGPAMDKKLILRLVQAAREAIEEAETNASATASPELQLPPHIADALEATYALYQKAVPLLASSAELPAIAAAIMPADPARHQEALELARQFKLVHDLARKAARQELAPENVDDLCRESSGTFLLFRKVMES